jgi:hypothetical protein
MIARIPRQRYQIVEINSKRIHNSHHHSTAAISVHRNEHKKDITTHNTLARIPRPQCQFIEKCIKKDITAQHSTGLRARIPRPQFQFIETKKSLFPFNAMRGLVFHGHNFSSSKPKEKRNHYSLLTSRKGSDFSAASSLHRNKNTKAITVHSTRWTTRSGLEFCSSVAVSVHRNKKKKKITFHFTRCGLEFHGRNVYSSKQ